MMLDYLNYHQSYAKHGIEPIKRKQEKKQNKIFSSSRLSGSVLEYEFHLTKIPFGQ